MPNHCCSEMDDAITLNCIKHKDIYSCPDVLIHYIPKFDEYGIIIHDGGSAIRSIRFCPWCGRQLPHSKRDAWFEALASLGIENPLEQEIPDEFNDASWYQNN